MGGESPGVERLGEGEGLLARVALPQLVVRVHLASLAAVEEAGDWAAARRTLQVAALLVDFVVGLMKHLRGK